MDSNSLLLIIKKVVGVLTLVWVDLKTNSRFWEVHKCKYLYWYWFAINVIRRTQLTTSAQCCQCLPTIVSCFKHGVHKQVFYSLKKPSSEWVRYYKYFMRKVRGRNPSFTPVLNLTGYFPFRNLPHFWKVTSNFICSLSNDSKLKFVFWSQQIF